MVLSDVFQEKESYNNLFCLRQCHESMARRERKHIKNAGIPFFTMRHPHRLVREQHSIKQNINLIESNLQKKFSNYGLYYTHLKSGSFQLPSVSSGKPHYHRGINFISVTIKPRHRGNTYGAQSKVFLTSFERNTQITAREVQEMMYFGGEWSLG